MKSPAICCNKRQHFRLARSFKKVLSYFLATKIREVFDRKTLLGKNTLKFGRFKKLLYLCSITSKFGKGLTITNQTRWNNQVWRGRATRLCAPNLSLSIATMRHCDNLYIQFLTSGMNNGDCKPS